VLYIAFEQLVVDRCFQEFSELYWRLTKVGLYASNCQQRAEDVEERLELDLVSDQKIVVLTIRHAQVPEVEVCWGLDFMVADLPQTHVPLVETLVR
jgi:hypothetical protein